MSADHIDVKIMNREYRIACVAEDHDQLLKVVALVDEKMSQIAGKTKNMIPERVAVMAAMSIAQELLAKPSQPASTPLAHPPSAENKHAEADQESEANSVSEETLARLSALASRIDVVLQEPSSTLM